jgi:CspA family cold shock protein
MSIRQTGTVRWFNDEKGEGRITPQDGGDDLYVHFKNVEGDRKFLKDGEAVSFVVERGMKGMGVTQVRRE